MDRLHSILEEVDGVFYGKTAWTILNGRDPIVYQIAAQQDPKDMSDFDNINISPNSTYARLGDKVIIIKHISPQQAIDSSIITPLAIAIKSSGEILDPYNGREDIDGAMIRTIKDPVVLFNESPISVLKIFNAMAEMRYVPSPEILDAVKRYGSVLRRASAIAIGDEMLRGLSINPGTFITSLKVFEIMKYISKEVDEVLDITDNLAYVCADLDSSIAEPVPSWYRIALLLRRLALGMVQKKYIPNLSSAIAEDVCLVDFGMSDEEAYEIKVAIRCQHAGAKSLSELVTINGIHGGEHVLPMIRLMWIARSRGEKEKIEQILRRFDMIAQTAEGQNDRNKKG